MRDVLSKKKKKEREEAEDDGKLKSFIINDVVEEEGFAEECSWSRQSLNSHSPKSYSSKHVSQHTFVDNIE